MCNIFSIRAKPIQFVYSKLNLNFFTKQPDLINSANFEKISLKFFWS